MSRCGSIVVACAVACVGLWVQVGCYTGAAPEPLRLGDDGANADGGAGADAGGDAGDDADDDDDPPRVGDACDADVGPTPLRRLTRRQYDNTIRDLLALDLGLAESFVADEKVSSFDANTTAPVTQLSVEQYQEAAEWVAKLAVVVPGAILPCDPAVIGEPACAEQFVNELGARALRRPMSAEQRDDLLALFFEARESGAWSDGMRVTIQALLQSPFFLYHLEDAPDDALAVEDLAPYEVASRLSYFLWESMPDNDLFAAAAAGELSTPEQIELQARRMLDDPKASDMIGHFHAQWLGLESLAHLTKDAALFPEFTPQLAASMQEEVERFAQYVIDDDDARLQTLLTASYTIADARMAEFYGVPAPDTGFARVDLPPGERSGVLSLAGVMAAHSHENQTSPVLRGVLVREHVLCQVPAPPPDDVDDTPPGLDPTLPTKERFEKHREDPVCAGCHDLIDTVGYGLEHYDAIGHYRTMDGVNPVDATGVLNGTMDEDVEYDGPLELTQAIAQGEQGQRCVATQWTRFALGRAQTPQDACEQEAIFTAFADSDFDIRELIVAIATSRSLRRLRSVAQGA